MLYIGEDIIANPVLRSSSVPGQPKWRPAEQKALPLYHEVRMHGYDDRKILLSCPVPLSVCFYFDSNLGEDGIQLRTNMDNIDAVKASLSPLMRTSVGATQGFVASREMWGPPASLGKCDSALHCSVPHDINKLNKITLWQNSEI